MGQTLHVSRSQWSIINETEIQIIITGKEKKDFLEKAIRDLSKEQKGKFFQLHDSKVGEKDEKTVDGIWRTNNFALGQSGSRSNNGLFLRISRLKLNFLNIFFLLNTVRFNHSCVPTAEFVWNEKKHQQEIRSIRHIRRGDEITICYFTKLVAEK